MHLRHLVDNFENITQVTPRSNERLDNISSIKIVLFNILETHAIKLNTNSDRNKIS